MYMLLTSTNDAYESSFVRNQGNRNSQLKRDHFAAECSLPTVIYIWVL